MLMRGQGGPDVRGGDGVFLRARVGLLHTRVVPGPLAERRAAPSAPCPRRIGVIISYVFCLIEWGLEFN